MPSVGRSQFLRKHLWRAVDLPLHLLSQQDQRVLGAQTWLQCIPCGRSNPVPLARLNAQPALTGHLSIKSFLGAIESISSAGGKRDPGVQHTPLDVNIDVGTRIDDGQTVESLLHVEMRDTVVCRLILVHYNKILQSRIQVHVERIVQERRCDNHRGLRICFRQVLTRTKIILAFRVEIDDGAGLVVVPDVLGRIYKWIV